MYNKHSIDNSGKLMYFKIFYDFNQQNYYFVWCNDKFIRRINKKKIIRLSVVESWTNSLLSGNLNRSTLL